MGYHLRPCVKHMRFYVKDTNNFINKIDAVKSVSNKQLSSNNRPDIIVYKYTKRRRNVSCKHSIRQLLKEKEDLQRVLTNKN